MEQGEGVDMAQLRNRMTGVAVAVAGVAGLVGSLLTSGGADAGASANPTANPGTSAGASSTAKAFSNPVLGPGQDPSVLTYQGWYYFTQSAPDAKSITIRRSRSIKSLAAAPKAVVWQAGQAGSPCCDWWAPELPHSGSSWSIYTTADDGNNDNHRLQVLQAAGPLGPYAYKGQPDTPGGG